MLDQAKQRGPSVEAFLLGQCDFDALLALEHRLVYEAGDRADGQITLLVCEHPPLVTVGRFGSRDHVRLAPRELASRQLDVRWVNRGGGAWMHAPGQLAIYPIVPLAWHGWTVGQYLGRLQQGLLDTLNEVGITGQTRDGWHGIWGRSGQLATVGVAVRNWTTYFGAYLNVEPALNAFRYVISDPQLGTPASSLAAERRQRINMSAVRAALVPRLAGAFGCQRYHLYTGHPLLAHYNRQAKVARTPVSHEL
jgi:lipoyl(octanoyl) transferase